MGHAPRLTEFVDKLTAGKTLCCFRSPVPDGPVRALLWTGLVDALRAALDGGTSPSTEVTDPAVGSGRGPVSFWLELEILRGK
jgi:hypothetical protein